MGHFAVRLDHFISISAIWTLPMGGRHFNVDQGHGHQAVSVSGSSDTQPFDSPHSGRTLAPSPQTAFAILCE